MHPPARQHVPKQEPGTRPSRALGYNLKVDAKVPGQRLAFTLANDGQLGAHLQARSSDVAGAPFSYTIGPGRRCGRSWPRTAATT